ncbi:MAG: hypothetical protein IJM56_08230 [Clostridia bacterium]|nr:hypothetical protein [Clostridia bacterium]
MPGAVRDAYYSLLKTWLDALLPYQVDMPFDASLDGGILCPACSMMHGRSHEAVYPLLCMADLSGEEKYLTAARKLLRWSEYMICDDGSFYNDSQSDWSGITVFAALSLLKALKYHARLLSKAELDTAQTRLRRACEWIGGNIVPERRLNINYVCAGAAALAAAARHFSDDRYLLQAKALGDVALDCISEDGLLYGEGTPVKRVTAQGVRPVDIGYNVEESLPCLYEYALEADDKEMKQAVTRLAEAHLKLMLPDGAWDNSFGTRNFKWTYWGGRTSDGCQALFNAMGKQNPVYAEAALRNLELMERATDSLLYGGLDYKAHGEKPCTHHVLCHAKALAQALDEGVCEFARLSLPSDKPFSAHFYRELNVYRAARGKWRMTVSGGDFAYMRGGCASGGVMTLLWHAGYGPVIASANTDYSLKEAHNQQLSRRKAEHQCVCARLEADGLSQMYDYGAALSCKSESGKDTFTVRAVLSDIDHTRTEGAAFDIQYIFDETGVTVKAQAASACRFILPIVCEWEKTEQVDSHRMLFSKNGAAIQLTTPAPMLDVSRVFNLAPGFCCARIVIGPDKENRLSFFISAL